MDKYESKLRIEEIEKLKKRKQYKEAARLADTIEWYRIKNTVTLYKVADLYKICRNYVKCRELLELAYERSPYAKNVVFALCDVCLEFGDFESATEHYKEYVSLAPDDVGVWVLKYKMLKALEAGIDERIEILETLKRKSRSEEWEFELATLYHRAGLAEKCVEECDDIITWYGEGSFVYKAMELKMLHEPLTPEQQAVYDGRLEKKKKAEERRTGQIPNPEKQKRHTGRIRTQEQTEKKRRREEPAEESNEEFHVKTINMGQFNTIDLQAELANNIQDYIGGEPSMIDRSGVVPADDTLGHTRVYSGAPVMQQPEIPAENAYEEPAFDPNAILKEDTTDSLLQIVSEAEKENAAQAAAEAENTEDIEFVEENRKEVFHNTIPADSQEVFFEDATGDLRFAIERPKKQEPNDSKLEQFKENYSKQRQGKELPEGYGRLDGEEDGYMETVPIAGGIVDEKVLEDGTVELIKHFEENVEPEVVRVGQDKKRPKNAAGRTTGPLRFAKPVQEESAEELSMQRKELDPDYVDMLPTSEDKQISGQLNIQDILAGWEETKKQKEREFQESMRKKTMEHTGNMFADFEKEANSGLLATLENPALINSVTDQSTSEDFFKGISVEDAKNGKQAIYPEKRPDDLKIGKVIEAPFEEEEDEPAEGDGWNYAPLGSTAIPAAKRNEELVEEDEENEESLQEEVTEETTEEVTEEPAAEAAEEDSDIEEVTEAADTDEDAEEITEEPVIEETEEKAVDPDEEMIQQILDEDEKESKERYYGSVTQKISGNIWDEVDNVPVKEVYSDPEPDEVGATKFMPSAGLVESEEAEEQEPQAEVVSVEEEAVNEEAAPEEAVQTEDEEEAEEASEREERRKAHPSKKDLKNKKKKKAQAQALAKTGAIMTETVKEEVQEKKEETQESGQDENMPEGIERELTKEEKKYFGPFLYSKRMKQQILDAIETMTLAAYTGNLIISADSGESSAELATLFYQYLKSSDSNFTGKAAKIGAEKLNKKDMNEIFEKLSNGALIVSHAGKMTNSTINGILQNLNQEARGVEVILHDTKNEIRRLLERAPVLESFFNCRVDIIAMSPEMLAEYGKKYALDLGYSIDNMAMLAFSGRISELQIGTHLVSVDEVKEIVQAAIEHADKPSADKAIRTMTGKRYDEDHRVILREKDFEFRKK